MATDVNMPRLSDSMEEGTVLKWLVEVGGEVKRGAPLVEIETDKANMTYEADTDGVLLEVVASEGDTLEVGEVIARIGAEGEEPAEAPATKEEPATAEQPEPEPERAEEAPEPPAPAPAGNGGERIKASPVARRIAGELGVELASLEGSGPGGRIIKADVESAAENGAPAKTEPEPVPEPAAEETAPAPKAKPAEAGVKGEPEVIELTRLQRTVSRRMAESKATAPDFALEVEVDMTLCIELRSRLKETAGDGAVPSFNDMIVKAAALAAREHPKVNGAYRDGRFELYPEVNVGVAVAAQDALVVPVVRGADQKSLGEIARNARALIEKVRDGSITPPELSGGTITVSNLGMYGIDRFTAIINPPQASILSVGALKKKPAVDEKGRVVARDLMTITMACDHRILYGADAAQFLARIRELLEEPLRLAL
ncbi:MAG TPA: dihydrolipoamide acetyltransferase family protein [Thermoleophilaceae bacterium]|nr:dihydrolipoamide acetyltransferase family protein [Thermoleophilaceae bacterium]